MTAFWDSCNSSPPSINQHMSENYSGYTNWAAFVATIGSIAKFVVGAAVATACLAIGRRWGRKP